MLAVWLISSCSTEMFVILSNDDLDFVKKWTKGKKFIAIITKLCLTKSFFFYLCKNKRIVIQKSNNVNSVLTVSNLLILLE